MCNIHYTIEMSETCRISISLQDLLDIAIIPVLKQSVSEIISCIIDENVFGYFEIAKLFVTGNFLAIKEYSDMYASSIIAELEKEFKLLISRYTYKTKYDLDIKTYRSTQKDSLVCFGHSKPFCFDVLTKGELRTVASKTYLECNHSDLRGKLLGSDGVFIVRGEELSEKTVNVPIPDPRTIISNGFLCKFSVLFT